MTGADGTGKDSMNEFDDLIRAKRDTDALRLMAREYYDKGKIGHTRMLLIVSAADEMDSARKELSFSRGKMQKKSVMDFLQDILSNEIIPGRKYDARIDIDDGGNNSYIGVCVYANDFQRRTPVIEGIHLFRHSNSVNKLVNTWRFELGDVCNPYADNPEIPLAYLSYGKTADEAEIEASQYFSTLRQLIREQTSDYKIKDAKTAQEEREKLLARLAELGDFKEAASND